jgi:hypothetical protein
MNIENSPHIFKYANDIKKAFSFSRVLNPRSRRKKYITMNKNKNKIIYPIHNGQRKLLMTEIEFITNEYHKLKNNSRPLNKIIVYIGASADKTSIHSYTLAMLFPEFEYHLYDDKDFYFKLYKLKNVKIFKRWFTNEDSKQYKNKNVLLISDMRDPLIGKAKNNKNEKMQNKVVFDDMAIQMKFYKDINPVSALLKFRLPWQSGKTTYLDGDIYYQLWQGIHSSETRLVPNGKIKEYDNTSYEERLFYFNTETRFRYYKHNYKCYGHCFDCMSEIKILENYIKLKKLKTSVCELGIQITKELSFYKERYIFGKPPLNEFKI